MFEVGNTVTLKTAEGYDSKTVIDTNEIGEIIEITTIPNLHGNAKIHVVEFANLRDKDELVVRLYVTASALDLHQH